MVKDHSDIERGNPLPHMGYSFRLAARVLLYASFNRQDNAYQGLCYTSWSTGWNENFDTKFGDINSRNIRHVVCVILSVGLCI